MDSDFARKLILMPASRLSRWLNLNSTMEKGYASKYLTKKRYQTRHESLSKADGELDEASGKIPVFCDYLTCLDVLSTALEQKIIHDDLNGKIDLQQRTKIVQNSQDEDDLSMPQVLLITIKCGNYRPAPTAASIVIMFNES